MNLNRVRSGVREGGQFATDPRSESDLVLTNQSPTSDRTVAIDGLLRSRLTSSLLAAEDPDYRRSLIWERVQAAHVAVTIDPTLASDGGVLSGRMGEASARVLRTSNEELREAPEPEPMSDADRAAAIGLFARQASYEPSIDSDAYQASMSVMAHLAAGTDTEHADHYLAELEDLGRVHGRAPRLDEALTAINMVRRRLGKSELPR